MNKINIRYSLLYKSLSIIFFTLPSLSIAFTIGGFVYDDKNCNGVRNGGESGIQGVALTLSPGAITIITNSSGHYFFTGVLPGTYNITETDPAGYCSTTPNCRVVKVKGNVLLLQQHFGESKKYVSPPGGCCQ